MGKWIKLPTEPLLFQSSQFAFLEALKQRVCPNCKLPYQSQPPAAECPDCKVKGKRSFDRMTIIAGRRFGKSKIGSIAAVFEACSPNSIIWCCAPTNPKLQRYVIPAVQQLIPEDWVKSWNSEFLDLRLKNGSLIHFQTLEDPDQGRGQGIDALWIDEVSELTQKHWDVIRPSLAGDTVAFFTTSPRGYDWVYKELFHPAEAGVPGYWACHAKTADSANPDITAEFLEREKAQMTDQMFRQEYEADFVIFQGAVYGNLIDQHILSDEQIIKKIIPEWPNIDAWRQVTVGIDTGADHPFGAVKLVATEKGFVVVGEYLNRDKTFSQHAWELKRIAANHNVRWAINKNERQQSLELAQYGIYCQKSENEVVSGTERVKSWLVTHQLWFIEKLCPNTIKQMKAYRWADNTAKDGQLRKEKVYKLDDELPDCIRYALMSWPVLPSAPPPEVKPPRDISALPGEIQASIMRMRRHDGNVVMDQDGNIITDKVTGMNDFYQ